MGTPGIHSVTAVTTTSVISSRAPSRLVPSVAGPKLNRTESALTPESEPISSRTQAMGTPGIRPVTAVTTLSVIPYSCTRRLPSRRRPAGGASEGGVSSGGMSADPGQRVPDQQVDDAGAAESGLEQHDAGLVRGDVADDRGLRAERMRAQRGQGVIGLPAVDDRDHPALAGHVH